MGEQEEEVSGDSSSSSGISSSAGLSKTRASMKCLLMVSMSRFYNHGSGQRLLEVLPYIEGTSNISLRLIDWFVTNYAKKHNIVLLQHSNNNAARGGTMTRFNVYLSYRSQLKAYSKQQFDPIRRRSRSISKAITNIVSL